MTLWRCDRRGRSGPALRVPRQPRPAATRSSGTGQRPVFGEVHPRFREHPRKAGARDVPRCSLSCPFQQMRRHLNRHSSRHLLRHCRARARWLRADPGSSCAQLPPRAEQGCRDASPKVQHRWFSPGIWPRPSSSTPTPQAFQFLQSSRACTGCALAAMRQRTPPPRPFRLER